MTAGLLAGLILGALWIVSGAIARLTGSDIVLTRLLSFAGIGSLQSHAWLLPGAWGVLVLTVPAAVLCSVVWVVGRGAQGVGRAPAVVESAPDTAYWGFAWGWIPAWAFSRRAGEESARRWSPRLLGVTVASVVALVVVGSLRRSGGRGRSGTGAGPGGLDSPTPADACTPDRATLLLGTADGATGHRAQSIRLMNISEEPCVVEGYPDIAFADQNGHALDVAVRPGSSFLATDPGSAPVTVLPQGEATAVIGWDANATDGAIVARALHASLLPGYDRGSWPVELDIVSGSEVAITVWHLGAAPAAP